MIQTMRFHVAMAASVCVLMGGGLPVLTSAQGTVVIAVGGDVDSFNEYVASSTLALDLADQLFLSLLDEQPGADGAPRFAPRLARAWTVAPDGLSVEFVLRDDVRWSDGTPTTAQDVLFTWQAQTDPKLGWADADLKANISDVKATGLYRVVFTLKRPSPWALLDINEGHILPAHILGQLPREQWATTDFTKQLVTNGPFRLAAWKPGQAIELARNPAHFEPGLPLLERVIFRVVADPAIRLQQLLVGENDLLEGVAAESLDRLEKTPSIRIVRFDQRMYSYIAWNNRRPMFADPRVRRALTHALDRAEMLRVLDRGMGRPAAGPIPSSLWAAHRGLTPLPFDPAQSRLLLAQAGWKDTDGDGVLERDGQAFRFDIEFNTGNSFRELVALRAAAQLAQVGVKATPRAVEWAAFQSKHREGNYDAFVAARIVSTRVDMDSFATGDAANYSGYSNQQVDQLARRAAQAPDLATAREAWMRAQEIVAQDQPVTFLFEQDRLYAANRRVEGLEPGSLGILSSLRKWKIAIAAPGS